MNRKIIESRRKPLDYLADLYHGATAFPCGWTKPHVVWGYFPKSETGNLQQQFFRELVRAQGFQRTPWQLVFPGQTAGLVKQFPPRPDGVNEYHVRFYEDGTIDCEQEVGRFHSMHWAGHREEGLDILRGIIDNAVTIHCQETRDRIRALFDTKQYSQQCIRHVAL